LTWNSLEHVNVLDLSAAVDQFEVVGRAIERILPFALQIGLDTLQGVRQAFNIGVLFVVQVLVEQGEQLFRLLVQRGQLGRVCGDFGIQQLVV
jgi:hypothetical protein